MTNHYYIGAEEIGKDLGLFLRLDYFALFRQLPKLGESIKNIEEWENDQLRLGRPLLASIHARSLKGLARGLITHSSTSEELCLVPNKYWGSFPEISEFSVILEGDKKGHYYLDQSKIKNLKQSKGKVVAITQEGEERICKTRETIKDLDFIVRNYSQLPTEFFGFYEHVMVHASQPEDYYHRDLMQVHGSFVRDLNLGEQKSLSKKIEEILTERIRMYYHARQPARLIIRGTYPDVYEVIRNKQET